MVHVSCSFSILGAKKRMCKELASASTCNPGGPITAKYEKKSKRTIKKPHFKNIAIYFLWLCGPIGLLKYSALRYATAVTLIDLAKEDSWTLFLEKKIKNLITFAFINHFGLFIFIMISDIFEIIPSTLFCVFCKDYFLFLFFGLFLSFLSIRLNLLDFLCCLESYRWYFYYF